MKRKFIKTYLDAAELFAQMSHCERLKVGAVIVTERSEALFPGYNGRPRGEPNVGEVDGVTHEDVQHAEVNALKKLMRSTESSVGSSLFCTHSPCRGCAIDIVDAGVKEVYFRDRFRSDEGLIYLLRHGVNVYTLDRRTDILYKVTLGWGSVISTLWDTEE